MACSTGGVKTSRSSATATPTGLETKPPGSQRQATASSQLERLVSWESQQQRCVALSTAEAELVALTEATKEAAWLDNVSRDLGVPDNGPLIVYEDNQAAIALTQDRRFSEKTKHMVIRWHYIHDAVNDDKIKIEFASTGDMLADAETKPQGPQQHFASMKGLGVVETISFKEKARAVASA